MKLLISTLILNLLVSSLAFGKGQLPQEIEPLQAFDTVVCFPEGPNQKPISSVSTSIHLYDNITFTNKSLNVKYLQTAHFIPLTAGDHAGEKITVKVSELLTRTHVAKIYTTTGSKDGILKLKVTEFTSVPEWFPVGIDGSYLDLHTGEEIDLFCFKMDNGTSK